MRRRDSLAASAITTLSLSNLTHFGGNSLDAAEAAADVGGDKPLRVGLVEICCYYHMRARSQAADTQPPEHLDYEMWTGPAPAN